MYTAHRIINRIKICGGIFNGNLQHCFLGARRRISSGASEIQTKYAQRLRQKAEEAGIPLPQLIEKAQIEQREIRNSEGQQLKSNSNLVKPGQRPPESSVKTGTSTPLPISRKDAPPIKALSGILNLPRIMSNPHTTDQISGLWTAYHASRSNGTGRGYICATIPLNVYTKMEQNGRSYPSFVIPIPRIQPKQETDSLNRVEENIAHEFYFLQWTFHASPPIPTPSDDPFVVPTSGSNPQTSIILFTPLQEYKIRNSFATPYLILTMYTDLAETHGIVLLRGEITPSTVSGSADRYMLSQADAQLLAMSLQKFYLWDENGSDLTGEKLLHTFHKNPQDFRWQELLKISATTI